MLITPAYAQAAAGGDANSHAYRARIALFVALASPEFLVQR